VSGADMVWPTIAELAAQEQELRWTHFDEDDAWRLGVALTEHARTRQLPLAIEILRADHLLFHAALPGTSPDNDSWLRRKARVVARFHRSSLHVGQLCRDAGRTLEDMFGVPQDEFAPHGRRVPAHGCRRGRHRVSGGLRPTAAAGPCPRGRRAAQDACRLRP
jgi:uncharacterized protein (UPF0303 family)